MTRIISIHEYELKPDVDEQLFEEAIKRARSRGLLRLPGLIGVRFLKGIRGARKNCYAAVWIYEDQDAWEVLWGPPGHPIAQADYPENWKEWENTVLSPFLAGDPDKITFTSYREL